MWLCLCLVAMYLALGVYVAQPLPCGSVSGSLAPSVYMWLCLVALYLALSVYVALCCGSVSGSKCVYVALSGSVLWLRLDLFCGSGFRSLALRLCPVDLCLRLCGPLPVALRLCGSLPVALLSVYVATG